MADPYDYTYPSPLEGYTGHAPLPQEKHDSGPHAKSFINPPSSTRTSAYDRFPDPITNGDRGGFDVHIYFQHTNEYETKFATELHERVRREFPELRTYRLWEQPLGPHPVGMFEVNLFTPAQFGAFVAWLVIHRGPLSALLHPNTDEEYRDHTQRATWLGPAFPLQVCMLRKRDGEKGQ